MKLSNIIYRYPCTSFKAMCLRIIRKPLRAFIIIEKKYIILAAPLRLVASYPVNNRENSYRLLLHRNYSSLATFVSLTVKATFTQTRKVSSESYNICVSLYVWRVIHTSLENYKKTIKAKTKTKKNISGTRTLRRIGHSRSFLILLV